MRGQRKKERAEGFSVTEEKSVACSGLSEFQRK